MKNDRQLPPLLQDVLPEVTEEITSLLLKEKEPGLAEKVSALRLVDRCRCGDDFCATIYTVAKPKGAWGPGHENIVLDPIEGYMVLDVVDGKITCIEVLDRKDIREKVLQILP